MLAPSYADAEVAEGAPSPSRRDSGESLRGPRSKRELEAERDRRLVEAARRGDELAFRQLVERYQPRAFAIAVQLLRDEHEAEELVQEAFLRVHRGLERFHGKASFFTWLYRIVKNLAVDALRKPKLGYIGHDVKTTSALPLEEIENLFVSRIDGGEPIDFVFRREAAVHLQQALDALPPYHRDVILMCAIEELTYDEIAQVMNVSRGTIMSRLFYARKKLRRALRRHYSESRGEA